MPYTLLWFLIFTPLLNALPKALKLDDEITYVDLTEGPIHPKFADCLTGLGTQTATGLRMMPNSALTIDLDRMVTAYDYPGTFLAIMLQYGDDYALHPNIQYGKVYFLNLLKVSLTLAILI
jgi:hypothetical protein